MQLELGDSLLLDFQSFCDQLNRGVNVNESNNWLISLMETNVESCLSICRYLFSSATVALATSESYVFFIASKMLHTVLRNHCGNVLLIPLLPSHEAILGTMGIGDCHQGLSLSSSQRQIARAMASLILLELSQAPLNSDQHTSSLLQLLIHYASQSSRNLLIFNTALAEIPTELRVFQRKGKAKFLIPAVTAILKPLVLKSFSISILSRVNAEEIAPSALNCLGHWCACTLPDNQQGDGGDGSQGDEDGIDDNESDSSAVENTVINLGDLTQIRFDEKTVWELLLGILMDSFVTVCMGGAEGSLGAAHSAQTIFVLVSELILFKSPSSLELASCSLAKQQQYFFREVGVLQLFLAIVRLWDSHVVQGGMTQWTQSLYSNITQRDVGYNLPLGIEDEPSLTVALVELTSSLAERHHGVIMAQCPWYKECWAAMGRENSTVPQSIDGASTASMLLTCLMASLGLPDLDAAAGCVEILTCLPSYWPEVAKPVLESALDPLVIIMSKQLRLPSNVGQQQSLEYEFASTREYASTSGSSALDIDVLQQYNNFRKDCKELLNRMSAAFPGGDRILVSIFTMLIGEMDTFQTVLTICGQGDDSARRSETSRDLENSARRVECLLFMWTCLVDGSMDLDFSRLIATPLSPPPFAPSVSRQKFVPALDKNVGKEAQAIELLHMSVEITRRIEAFGTASVYFPILFHRCLCMWTVLPDAVGLFPPIRNTDDCAATAAHSSDAAHLWSCFDLRAVLQLVTVSGGSGSYTARCVALDALLALTQESVCLRYCLRPYALQLCEWLLERIASGAFAGQIPNLVAKHIENLHTCLGRIINLVDCEETKKTLLATTLTTMIVQLDTMIAQLSALSSPADVSTAPSNLTEIVQVCSMHLQSLEGFIRGLGLSESSGSSDSTSGTNIHHALECFGPRLYGGLFSMLKIIFGILVTSRHSSSTGLQFSIKHYAILSELANNVCSVSSRLIELYHTEGVLTESLSRLSQIVMQSLNNGVIPSANTVSLTIILVRWGSDYGDNLLGPTFDLVTKVLTGLQHLFVASTHNSCANEAGACKSATSRESYCNWIHPADEGVNMEYAIECYRLIRQISVVQAKMLQLSHLAPLGSHDSVSKSSRTSSVACIPHAFFWSVQQFLQGSLEGRVAFHAGFMRTVSAVLIDFEGSSADVRECICNVALQSSPVDLFVTLILGSLFQQLDPRIVKHFAIFFDSIASILRSRDDHTLPSLLAEACKRIGESQGGGSENAMKFMHAIFERIMQSVNADTKMRSGMSALRKWALENKV